MFAATLVLTLLSTGCASLSKPFSVREVSPGIFAGPKPRTQADLDVLRARGVRTILSFEQLPWHIYPERRHARENGLAYVNVPIMASPLQPREKRVKEALLALSDSSLRPVFIHCYLGEDRNSFIVGLYRIYYQDWTPEAAWEEMLQSGFHVRLTLRGFETYFWSHTRKPDWVGNPRSVKGACMDQGGRPRDDMRAVPKREEICRLTPACPSATVQLKMSETKVYFCLARTAIIGSRRVEKQLPITNAPNGLELRSLGFKP